MLDPATATPYEIAMIDMLTSINANLAALVTAVNEQAATITHGIAGELQAYSSSSGAYTTAIVSAIDATRLALDDKLDGVITGLDGIATKTGDLAETQAEFLVHATSDTHGLYVHGSPDPLGRAMAVTALRASNTLPKVIDELQNPTPLPGIE